MKKHLSCCKGAAVRIGCLIPAKVRAVFVKSEDRRLWAECIVTARTAEKAGPWQPGQRIYVLAVHAVPRDAVYRTRRGIHWGSLAHREFSVIPTGMFDGMPGVVSSDYAGTLRASA